uniref:Uncharacterized protein n=1 Tax=Steinernema glaseri TaxID=37863 RepID=A0A1I7ZF45_9BILA
MEAVMLAVVVVMVVAMMETVVVLIMMMRMVYRITITYWKDGKETHGTRRGGARSGEDSSHGEARRRPRGGEVPARNRPVARSAHGGGGDHDGQNGDGSSWQEGEDQERW